MTELEVGKKVRVLRAPNKRHEGLHGIVESRGFDDRWQVILDTQERWSFRSDQVEVVDVPLEPTPVSKAEVRAAKDAFSAAWTTMRREETCGSFTDRVMLNALEAARDVRNA